MVGLRKQKGLPQTASGKPECLGFTLAPNVNSVAWNPWQGVFRSMSIGEHPPRHLERRWAPRYSFRAELEIEWGSAVLRGKTRDISSNGMFIESNDTLWVGAGFTARLALERPVQIDCSVKRVEPGRGMAVAVTASEEQHRQRYQDLIASLAPRQP